MGEALGAEGLGANDRGLGGKFLLLRHGLHTPLLGDVDDCLRQQADAKRTQRPAPEAASVFPGSTKHQSCATIAPASHLSLS